jgi:hypothetical protein
LIFRAVRVLTHILARLQYQLINLHLVTSRMRLPRLPHSWHRWVLAPAFMFWAFVGSAAFLLSKINLDIQLPPDFPEKYKTAVIRAADQCAVKKHLENPPTFEVTTSIMAEGVPA